MLTRLIALQDPLQLKHDLQDSTYEEIGFPATEPDAMAALDSEIEKLKAEIDPRVSQKSSDLTTCDNYGRLLYDVP